MTDRRRSAWLIERSEKAQPEHRRSWHVMLDEGGFETRKLAKRWASFYSGEKFFYRTVMYVPAKESVEAVKGKK